jgi:hypothetical protein
MLGTSEWLHNLRPLEWYSAPQSQLPLCGTVVVTCWRHRLTYMRCYRDVKSFVSRRTALASGVKWWNSTKSSIYEYIPHKVRFGCQSPVILKKASRRAGYKHVVKQNKHQYLHRPYKSYTNKHKPNDVPSLYQQNLQTAAPYTEIQKTGNNINCAHQQSTSLQRLPQKQPLLMIKWMEPHLRVLIMKMKRHVASLGKD